MIEKPDRVERHVLEGVASRALIAPRQLPERRNRTVVEPGRSPDVAIVESNDEKTARGEVLTEPVAPPDHLRREPRDQHERGVRVVAERLVTELQVADCSDPLAGS